MKFVLMVRVVMASIALPALCITGCGTAKPSNGSIESKETAARQQQIGDFKQLGVMYHSYLEANGDKAPTSADDFIKYAGSNSQLVQVVQKVKSGQYVIIWGLTTQDLRKSLSLIVGYEKDAPTSGGVVMLGTGAARYMTVAEFQSTPKASGK